MRKLNSLKTTNQAWIAGISQALSQQTGISLWLIRISFVVSFFAFGLGLIAYLWLWSKVEPDTGQMTMSLGM